MNSRARNKIKDNQNHKQGESSKRDNNLSGIYPVKEESYHEDEIAQHFDPTQGISIEPIMNNSYMVNQ